MPIVKTLKQHKILLDTHVWLWVMSGSPKLAASFRRSFEHALISGGVLVSVLSVWEIAMLVEKKRIEVDMDVMEWVDQALDIPGMRLCGITQRIAIQSTRLPGFDHGDLVDRFLVTTAHLENAVLITCDEKILRYGKDKFINVFDPS